MVNSGWPATFPCLSLYCHQYIGQVYDERKQNPSLRAQLCSSTCLKTSPSSEDDLTQRKMLKCEKTLDEVFSRHALHPFLRLNTLYLRNGISCLATIQQQRELLLCFLPAWHKVMHVDGNGTRFISGKYIKYKNNRHYLILTKFPHTAGK